MSTPQKDVAYEFYWALTDIDDPVFDRVNPTIAAGDFKVSVNGGAFSNLDTLPVVTPAGSSSVKINLSAVEMSGDKVVVTMKDQSADEWGDVFVFFDLTDATTQGVMDILQGDHTETSVRLLINKKDTSIPVLDKTVTGSLLDSDITINTRENP